MLGIITAPNEILSQKAKPVKKIDKGIVKLIDEMKEALQSARDPVGVGLAASQVGKDLDIFVAKPTVQPIFFTFINPKIIEGKNPVSRPVKKKKRAGLKKLEGCLSLPNIWGEVRRENDILVSYEDEEGKMHKKKFKGFMSTIIQHEIDHLNGVLFPKRVLEQGGTLYKSEKDEKGEDIFEEIKI